MERKTGAIWKLLLHMAAICLIFLFTNAFQDTVIRFCARTGLSNGWVMALYVCLDLLHVWFAVLVYAGCVLKLPVRNIYFIKPQFSLRWCLAAVLLPAAVNGFYLVFTKGIFLSGCLSGKEQAALFLLNFFVYGIKPAVICGMLFRGLALGAFQNAAGQKTGMLLSAFFYAAVSSIPEIPALGSLNRWCLLFFARFVSGAALSAVTCTSGCVWHSVMIDAMYRAFGGDGTILHIDTEQAFSSIATYTLLHDHWTIAGLSGNFYLETALPAITGFLVLAIYASRSKERHKYSESVKPKTDLARSLTGKLLMRLACGLAVSCYLFLLLFFGGRTMLRQYFAEHGTSETALAENFQTYVQAHHVAAIDADAVTIWLNEQALKEFFIARKGRLLFDASYPGELLHGSKKMPGSVWRPYYRIVFADGDADVYLSTGFDQFYYRILFTGAAVCSFGACLWIILSGMLETVSYVQCLEREVAMIRQGCLSKEVTVNGKDELGQLALGLEQMRRQLLETMETEKQMRAAHDKLVLGMSHDLRTPLSGLFTYMDVVKKRERDGMPVQEYLDKAYDKIQQIKHLSDQMFEYFLIDSQKRVELEPSEEMSSAFGDYLSELCALLDCGGFDTDCTQLVWKNVFVRVNTDYLGRIMDNIYSNLEKYADRDKKVRIRILYEQTRAGIVIENSMALPGQYVEGRGIGVKNMMLMMEQMEGEAQVQMTQTDYRITLYFPLRGTSGCS